MPGTRTVTFLPAELAAKTASGVNELAAEWRQSVARTVATVDGCGVISSHCGVQSETRMPEWIRITDRHGLWQRLRVPVRNRGALRIQGLQALSLHIFGVIPNVRRKATTKALGWL